jgi:hypothetical protein
MATSASRGARPVGRLLSWPTLLRLGCIGTPLLAGLRRFCSRAIAAIFVVVNQHTTIAPSLPGSTNITISRSLADPAGGFSDPLESFCGSFAYQGQAKPLSGAGKPINVPYDLLDACHAAGWAGKARVSGAERIGQGEFSPAGAAERIGHLHGIYPRGNFYK